MSRVLVTGGNGYLGTQVVAALLRQGQEVRATVRSANSEPEIREALRRGGADDGRLEVVTADLATDEGWARAVVGVDVVHHVASPIPPAQPEDPDQLIIPAREGTLRVLTAAREAGARRVVLTSSFAAVGYSPKAVRDYTEEDWTDPDTPGLPPYPRSKTIAERAAWDYIERHPGDIELVVVNPTFIIGPTLVTAMRSSLVAIKAIAEGTLPALCGDRSGFSRSGLATAGGSRDRADASEQFGNVVGFGHHVVGAAFERLDPVGRRAAVRQHHDRRVDRAPQRRQRRGDGITPRDEHHDVGVLRRISRQHVEIERQCTDDVVFDRSLAHDPYPSSHRAPPVIFIPRV